MAEIEAVLQALPSSPAKEPQRLLDVVLVDGVQDHGPGEHDYPAWQNQWTKLLNTLPGLTVQKARDWPSAQQWRDAEVVVLYFWNHDWSAKRLAELDAFLARGGGVVVLHSALISDDAPEALATRFGLAAQPQRTKYRHGPTELHFGEKPKSPLVAGFSPLALTDETYWPMIGDRSKVKVLATAVEDGQEWPMLWTFETGKGRVFASILGHYAATYGDPLFQVLALRGIAWAANEPLDRLQRLVGPAPK
jgi:type 1 glutamine amidotransferase